MKTWSVEKESNSWMDDTFNGTFEECAQYCKSHNLEVNGEEARLAEVEIDEDGCVTYCYDIIEEL